MRRLLLPIVLAPALVVALMPVGAAAATGPPVPELEWGPCEDEELEPGDPAECATLTVPIDWDDPDGETIELALARRAAENPDERIGVLIDMPGGPWGSGVDNVLFGSEDFSEEVRERFDLVGFDPRGAARSHPVVCSLDLLEQMPEPVISSRKEFNAQVAYNAELREDCREQTGPLYDHVDSLNVVRDLDAIRSALGEQSLSFFGTSYGTLTGQQYAEYYPDRVRAFALDSTMDHSLGTGAFLRTEAEAAQDSFEEFVTWCQSTESCALHGVDVVEFWHDLLDRADAGEITNPEDPELTVTSFQIISLAATLFYGPQWADLAEILLALSEGGGGAEPLIAGWGGEQPEVAPNPFPAVFCSDYSLPVRSYREWSAHLKRSARHFAPDMRYSTLALLGVASCLGHEPVNNPQAPADVQGTPALLLGNSLYDPATPYSWATNLERQLGDEGVLLTYEGWGHGVYGRSDCTTGAFDDYLIDLEVPEPGTRCPAVPPEDLTTLDDTPQPLPPGPAPGVPGWIQGG